MKTSALCFSALLVLFAGCSSPNTVTPKPSPGPNQDGPRSPLSVTVTTLTFRKNQASIGITVRKPVTTLPVELALELPDGVQVSGDAFEKIPAEDTEWSSLHTVEWTGTALPSLVAVARMHGRQSGAVARATWAFETEPPPPAAVVPPISLRAQLGALSIADSDRLELSTAEDLSEVRRRGE